MKGHVCKCDNTLQLYCYSVCKNAKVRYTLKKDQHSSGLSNWNSDDSNSILKKSMWLLSWKKRKKEVSKKYPDESNILDTENLDKMSDCC